MHAVILLTYFLFTFLASAKAQLPPRPDATMAPSVVPKPVIAQQGGVNPAPSAEVAPPPSPAPRKPSYNNCNVEGSCLAITFDDGPHPKNTPRLLDMLKERGIKATFYVIGQNAAQYPEIVQRIVAEGHEIGNHSYTHAALTKCSPAKVAEEINKTNEAIALACGAKPATVRPPYGATNSAITKRLNDEFNLAVIMWSVDPLDWKIRNASHVSSHILQNAKSGSIVLSHDIHPSTIDAMPAVLDGLIAKGYKFATVSELIAMDKPGSPKDPGAPAPASYEPKTGQR